MEQPQIPLKVPAAEFQRNIGRYQDVALRQPVSVTRNGRERTVLISAEEYARLKRRDRQVMSLADFSAADLAALESARTPAEAERRYLAHLQFPLSGDPELPLQRGTGRASHNA